MPELTDKQVAAFLEMLTALQAAEMDLPITGRAFMLVQNALATLQPKVTTIVEAAQQTVSNFRAARDDGRSAEESWELFVSSGDVGALATAFTFDREAQAAAEHEKAAADAVDALVEKHERVIASLGELAEKVHVAADAPDAQAAAERLAVLKGRLDDVKQRAAAPEPVPPDKFADWEYEGNGYIRFKGGGRLGGFNSSADASYAVQCHRALAGCNPDKLGELVEAVRYCLQPHRKPGATRLHAALAAFKPEATK